MQAALRFYVDVLGFENAHWARRISQASLGTVLPSTCAGAVRAAGAAWIWIGVEDAQQLYEDLKARGVTIREGPTNYPWALEFRVEDPDGNVIRFGSEPL
jgi:catechol 2,3-dioxygenase-like lactoylglutathione lyase family enzyme